MRINPNAKAMVTGLAFQVGMNIVSSVAINYGTAAAVRGVEFIQSKIKKKRPIGFK